LLLACHTWVHEWHLFALNQLWMLELVEVVLPSVLRESLVVGLERRLVDSKSAF